MAAVRIDGAIVVAQRALVDVEAILARAHEA